MKILLTTDFTPSSDNAIDYALQLFKKEKEVSYVLLHAYKSMVPYSTTPPAITVMNNDELKDSMKNKFEEVKEMLPNNIDVASEFISGTLSKAVQEVLDKHEIDLIVMGSREKSVIERMALGSNVLDVASKINCPILVVPKEAKYHELDKIVFASDLEPLNVNYDSLTMLKELAGKSESKLDVLHVFKDEDEKAKELEKDMEDTALHRYLWDVDHEHSAVVNSSATDGITEYVGEQKPDLLTLVPRDRNVIEKIFHNTTTENMLHHTQVPMLLML